MNKSVRSYWFYSVVALIVGMALLSFVNYLIYNTSIKYLDGPKVPFRYFICLNLGHLKCPPLTSGPVIIDDRPIFLSIHAGLRAF